MMLFLDTEWADSDLGSELVSIGLVGADDRFTFYAERDPLPLEAPEFVKAVVYPLLERGEKAMRDAQLSAALRDFIQKVGVSSGDGTTIAYDYHMDRTLFNIAWSGLRAGVVPVEEPSIGWYDLNGLDPDFSFGLEEHFEAELAARKTRHHALTDAFAARAGYHYAMRRRALL